MKSDSMNIRFKVIIGAVIIGLVLISCKTKLEEKPLFEILEEKHTGISFSNNLTTTLEKNIFNYL